MPPRNRAVLSGVERHADLGGTRLGSHRARELNRDDVSALADRLGVGARHLSRLFAEQLDASPLQVALSLRVQRAKRMLEGTDAPIAEIARRAGFSHARRMSAAFARLYGRPPVSFRKSNRR
jgi:AraC family transcriptional regulator, regulatory protein of adaptative response / methylated-DNA-[protein]-cysteine methyltransferase